MRDFSNYKTHIEIDMKDYSGKFHFNEQLRQEGTDIKINDESTQVTNDVDTTIRAIVRNHGNEYNESKEERSIMIDKEYDYKSGDYVEYLGDTYLTNNSIDKDNPFFNTAKMTRCNYTLKFMINGQLYTMSAIVTNNTKYTLGIKDQSVGITEGNGMFGAIVSYNDISKKIPLGHRFIVNGQAWEATQLDHSSTPNVLSILLGESSKSTEYDDMENEIADAFLHNYAITLNSTSESMQETSTFQITPVVSDNGTVISTPTVVYTSSDETIATIDSNGLITAIAVGNCTITTTIGSVSATLNLEVTAKSIEPTISYGYNWSNSTNLKTYMSSTITLTKTVDSVSNSLVVSYSLDSMGTTLLNAGNISITKKSDYSYQIKNVNVSSVKSFVITFTDSSDDAIITTQTINLSGM